MVDRLNDLDLMGVYLTDISKYPVLTVAEEEKLVLRLRDGDETAKQTLIQCNLRLVVTIARQYVNQYFELFDLVQEGNIGLIEAANDFVSKTGTRFKSYCDNCIRNQIIDAIRTKPKLKPLSLDLDDGLEDITPDRASPDPSDQVIAKELSEDVTRKLGLLPTNAAITAVLKGYSTSELSDELKQEYADSLRQLAHPSRA